MAKFKDFIKKDLTDKKLVPPVLPKSKYKPEPLGPNASESQIKARIAKVKQLIKKMEETSDTYHELANPTIQQTNDYREQIGEWGNLNYELEHLEAALKGEPMPKDKEM